MHVKLGDICPQTLTTTITIGQQRRIASLKERRPVSTGYLLTLDLHDGSPLLKLLEHIEQGKRQPVQYCHPGRA